MNGQTLLFPVIGNPVRQVRAPELLTDMLAKHQMNAVCIPLEMEERFLANFAAFVRMSPSIGGFLVTIPHKLKVLPLVDTLDSTAETIGAVNFVLKKRDQLIGFNFDAYGFAATLQKFDIQLQGQRVLLFGAGGAGRSLLHVILAQNPQEVVVLNRTGHRFSTICNHSQLTLATLDSFQPAHFSCLFNATPLGLKRDDLVPDIVTQSKFDRIYDVNMSAFPNCWQTLAELQQMPYNAGHDMLQLQLQPMVEAIINQYKINFN